MRRNKHNLIGFWFPAILLAVIGCANIFWINRTIVGKIFGHSAITVPADTIRSYPKEDLAARIKAALEKQSCAPAKSIPIVGYVERINGYSIWVKKNNTAPEQEVAIIYETVFVELEVDKAGNLKRQAEISGSQFRPGDSVSIVAYSEKGRSGPYTALLVKKIIIDN